MRLYAFLGPLYLFTFLGPRLYAPTPEIVLSVSLCVSVRACVRACVV